MKKIYLFLVAVLGVMSLNAQSKVAQPVSTEYNRSSVSYIFVNRSSQNSDIHKFYQNFQVDAKFDDNKIPTKFIDVIHSSNQPVTAENVTAFVNSSKLGKEVMSFIFNRKSDGTFDDSIVRDRGMYNATDQDILNMRVAKVKEVAYEWGEPLVNSSYVVVYDIYQHQSEKDENGNITYKVNVAAHAYKLNAGTEFINNFYKTAWADASSSEAEKEAARKGFDKMQIEFTHVASVSASGSSSTNSLWTGSFYEACQNAYKSVVQALENRIPAWQTATSVISLNPIAAKIGTKEGLTNGSRYEAYSFREDAQGNLKSVKQGMVRATVVASNTSVASGNSKPSYFYQISGVANIQEGWILKQKNDYKIGAALSLGLGALGFRAGLDLDYIANISQKGCITYAMVNAAINGGFTEAAAGVGYGVPITRFFEVTPYAMLGGFLDPETDELAAYLLEPGVRVALTLQPLSIFAGVGCQYVVGIGGAALVKLGAKWTF
ncbi:MAG: hypothetical protein J6U53_05355 [Tidjanibacter sp.]|nr:hypothetical protein [Tidjanibacter sp.]